MVWKVARTDETRVQGRYVIISRLDSIIFASISFLDRFITNLVGTAYPAYWTMNSIESKREDNKHSLIHWVVFGCPTIIRIFSGFLLKFIPFYFFIKIVFSFSYSNSQVCNIVYYVIFVKMFKPSEQDIDHATWKIGEFTRDQVNQGRSILDENKIKLFILL